MPILRPSVVKMSRRHGILPLTMSLSRRVMRGYAGALPTNIIADSSIAHMLPEERGASDICEPLTIECSKGIRILKKKGGVVPPAELRRVSEMRAKERAVVDALSRIPESEAGRGVRHVIGVDESVISSLPNSDIVVVAAVLPEDMVIPGLSDSKNRESMRNAGTIVPRLLTAPGCHYGIAHLSVKEVQGDRYFGTYVGHVRAVSYAIHALTLSGNDTRDALVLRDGKNLPLAHRRQTSLFCGHPCHSEPRGDANFYSVGAASMIATYLLRKPDSPPLPSSPPNTG
eukprot:TRINITY_DN75119_c0_g1_i1.p1 TRINITY_DN75119_c0_g1~~TRINITY_DN75119_c0_g1_i1.p1  ORF type:complete len:286 (+),score=33.56 TRINITY_DN75119_c0_g1_i1:45-902(+)